jgi:superfamily I DNA/RNA helicase
MNISELFSEVESSSSGARQSATSSEFSEEQAAALHAPFDEDALLCAGAGAGKTRVLVARVARLLHAGANPRRVAVVAFTRKSAAEIATRTLARIGNKKKLPVCTTVHALALKVLTRKGAPVNLASEEQERAGLEVLREFLPDDLEALQDSELLLAIHRAREEGAGSSVIGMLGAAYAQELRESGLDDFTSLLARASEEPVDLFDHILVDESQDLSQLQVRFLRAIGPKANRWFIGDPDQAIYAFRGAHATMMHSLNEEIPRIYTLGTNYRSAQRIVTHANNVIAHNPNRFPIVWKAARAEEGLVDVQFHEHGEHELAAAITWAKRRPTDRCVLARTQALIAPLKAMGLPAMTVHESKGLEWPEVLIIGCEAGMFPHPLAPREEERRLFYVAMTRAKDKLTMSVAANRSHKNPQKKTRHPSGFLYETQALEAK